VTPEIERATVFGQSARAVFEEFMPDRPAAMAPLFAARAEVVATIAALPPEAFDARLTGK